MSVKEASLMLGGDPGVATTSCLVIFQPVDFFEGKKKSGKGQSAGFCSCEFGSDK